MITSVITAKSVVANFDFKKIEESNFTKTGKILAFNSFYFINHASILFSFLQQ